jgi:diacylglycerol kinase
MSSNSRQTWSQKFRHAFRGIKQGVRGQSSFFVHFFAAAAVIIAALVLKCERADWYALLLCITLVLAAEMFNSALESLAKSLRRDYDPHIADALDIGSAAVLVASIGAVCVGALVFLNRLGFHF